MNKLIYKPTFIVSMTLLLILSSLSANKSLFPSLSWISQDTKMNCIQFQNLRGSNRINEFKKVASKIFDEQRSKNEQSKYDISFNDIEKLLGKPDNILQNGDWEYYLDYNQEGIKAIVTQNKNNGSINCTILDITNS